MSQWDMVMVALPVPDLPVRQVRLKQAEDDVSGQPPAGLHLAAAPHHRQRDRHLMTEHQILT